MAIAVRRTNPETGDVLSTEILAGIRPCRIDEEGALVCEGDLKPRPAGNFSTSSEMTEGAFSFTDGRNRTSDIHFQADDPYQATGRKIPNDCGGVTVDEYEYALNATANGVLFGRRVTTKDADPELESMERFTEWRACSSSN